MGFIALVSRIAILFFFLSTSIVQCITVKVATHNVNLLSHTVREEYVFQIDKTASDHHFDFLLSSNQSQHLAYFQAWVGKDKNDLVPVSQVESHSHPLGELRRIDLSATSSKSCLVRIEVSTVSVTVPFPHRIAQGAEHRYRYGSSAAILSPYPIGEQATQFLVKKVSQFTQGLPAAVHSDDSLKFGPYKNLPALATNYDLEMVFTNNFPNIRLFNMARKLTLSHAYSSIMVEEKYDLTNESPKLLKEFSRVEYGQSFFHADKVYPLQVIHIHLPKTADFISYRDEVGNISTSHARPTSQDVFLELAPRFPLFGGWNCSFELSYFLPLTDFLSSDGSVHSLSMPIVHLFNDVSVTNFTFEIVLPEGARFVTANPLPLMGTGHVKVGSRIESSYLDTIGRNVFVLQAQNVVNEASTKPFTIVYEYGFFDQLRKLLLIIAVYLFLFVSLICYKVFSFDPFPCKMEQRESNKKMKSS